MAASRMRLVFAVGERLRRGDGDRVAGVHAHGIEVLDRADDDDVVVRGRASPRARILSSRAPTLRSALRAPARGRGRARALPSTLRGCKRCRRPMPPSVNDGRMMTGKPILPANSSPSFRLLTSADFGTSRPICCIASLKSRRSSAFLMAREVRADQLHVVFFQHAAVGKFDGQIQRGLSADRRQNGKIRAARRASRVRCG